MRHLPCVFVVFGTQTRLPELSEKGGGTPQTIGRDSKTKPKREPFAKIKPSEQPLNPKIAHMSHFSLEPALFTRPWEYKGGFIGLYRII